MIITGNYGNQKPKFEITDTKPHVPAVTFSAQGNVKLLKQLKAGFKWNKYQWEPTLQTRNWYLNYLIDPSFQGLNRLFVLSFENDAHPRSCKQYVLLTAEIKDYNVIIDGKNFFDQPVKNDLITYENIWKIASGQEDYTAGCFLDYHYFRIYYIRW